MRTTLALDEDVAQMAREVMQHLGRPSKQVINEALRNGLEQLRRPSPAKPYRTVPKSMGLREGLSLDSISEVLARVEGEDFR
jgi:hypothetical protein